MSEFKDRWIAALETTNHPQGHGQLCKGGAYCCLGVAAEIMGELQIGDEGVGFVVTDGCIVETSYYGPNGELEESAPGPIAGTYMEIRDICIDLNDRNKWSFRQIAEWLRTVDF